MGIDPAAGQFNGINANDTEKTQPGMTDDLGLVDFIKVGSDRIASEVGDVTC
jgi:hypothetical protein